MKREVFFVHKKADLQKVKDRFDLYQVEKPIMIRVTPITRSDAQNKLLHEWFRIISKEFEASGGEFYSPKEWKAELKEKFLGYESVNTPSGVKEQLRHTSELNVHEMSEFLEAIEHYCGMYLNINLEHTSTYREAIR